MIPFAFERVEVLNSMMLLEKFHPLLGSHSRNTLNYDSLKSFRPPCLNELNESYVPEIIVFCPCSPRSHKNPGFLLSVALRHPSVLFIATLPASYFNKQRGIPKNLICLGPIDHEATLSHIGSDCVDFVLFPSKMETYGLPVFESVRQEKRLALPRRPFFDFGDQTMISYYEGDSPEALDEIIFSASSAHS
jgi:hypothetical protein